MILGTHIDATSKKTYMIKRHSFNQSTVPQMAERVAADPRVHSSNPAKDPMVRASSSQEGHTAINNHKVFRYYKPGS